jgi:hypothetical protein
MRFHPWPDYLKFGSPQPRAPGVRTRCTSRCPARTRLSLEALEERSLPSVGPLPIPGSSLPIPNPFGGPDVHFRLPGPADSTNARTGGEPSTITDFNGFIGVANVEGTGTDNNGNSLLWEADLRFMQGVYVGVDGNVHKGTFAFV